MYKEWSHFYYLMRANALRSHYKIMHESHSSLLLWSTDNYKSIYVTVIRTSDKCYRIIIQQKNYDFPDMQSSQYLTVREVYQLVEILAYIINKSGTLTHEPKKEE